MTDDKFIQIIHKITQGQHTEAELSQLRKALLSGDNSQLSLQLGKFNVNISEGKDIHIGDRIYNQWDEKAMEALVKVIQQASGIHQNTHSGDVAGRDIDNRNIYQNCTIIQLLAGNSDVGNDSQESLNDFNFHDIPQESIQKAYQDALPLDAGVWGLRGNNISQILKELEEFRRLPEFFAQLSKDTNISEEIRKKLIELAIKPASKKSLGKNENNSSPGFFSNIQGQFKSYLIATVEHCDDNNEQFLLNAWLLIDDSLAVNDLSKFESLLDQDEQQRGTLCKFNDIEQQLNKYLKKSLKRLRGQQYQLIIEVFLPINLMCTEVDRWKISDPIDDEITLGIKYHIRLRSLERLNLEYLDSYLYYWKENWKKVRNVLHKEPIQNSFEHLEEMESFNWKLLKIKLNEKIGLKVTCAPPKARTKELFKAILTATTPIAIWTRCDIHNLDQVIAINEVLTFKPLCHLCESVRQTREIADAQTEEHLGFHLALLWENPHRLTPDVMSQLITTGQ
ncbi:MAG TPA: hypothetical protein V6D15_02790 [Oculatellaceae cyanobacterium]|jgi:hypothetical protein